MEIDKRLKDLNIELPKPSAPAANYIPFVITGKLIYVSGQVPVINGKLNYVGTLGDNLSVDEGYQAARICGLNLISHVHIATGKQLNRVKHVIKLGGFVNSTTTFTDQPKVINGASDLMVQIFDNIGKHARFAVSAPSLPLGVSVEVDGIFELY